jgi:prepilin-type N-terminal cleavage/methylation domain-containing protein
MMMPYKTLQARASRRSPTGDPLSSILYPHVSPRGFTLIELMISIALVLLLILGVNQVFTYTTQAVGAGEAINDAIRGSRAAQAQMADDFAGIVPNGTGVNDSGSMIISSRAYYAFRDAKDQASLGTLSTFAATAQLPNAAYLDLNGDGIFGDSAVNGEVIYPSTYNFRNHRLDTLSFFARGVFQRQTGNNGTFVDPLTSHEAWIWYGHLQLPDNGGDDPSIDYPNNPPGSGVSTFPCMGSSSTNPNNYFGSKLTLGRVAMLLVQPNASNAIPDSQGVGQWYIQANNPFFPIFGSDNTKLYTSASPVAPEVNGFHLMDSRVDLAGTTIQSFQQALAAQVSTGYFPWPDSMMVGSQTYSPTFVTRFRCKPFVTKPMTSEAMAQASPVFLSGCSQFIVEFAGNFLTQDEDPSHTLPPSGTPRTRTNWGDVTGLATNPNLDRLDFTITYPNYTPTNPGAPLKQIKWYGMPRSTTGHSYIYGPSPYIVAIPNSPNNADVVPVRDWLQNIYDPTNGSLGTPASYTNASFEHVIPPLSEMINYAGTSGLKPIDAQNGYVCAFGPFDPHPSLIRVTFTLDDPTGRLPDGQTYQYIFKVPLKN